MGFFFGDIKPAGSHVVSGVVQTSVTIQVLEAD